MLIGGELAARDQYLIRIPRMYEDWAYKIYERIDHETLAEASHVDSNRSAVFYFGCPNRT